MAVIEMSNLEVRTLFEAWNFVPESGNGGHLRMRHKPTGKVVQITAPGRNTPTPYRALKKAADACGVSVHEFKMGPPCEKAKPDHDIIDLEALDRELQEAQARVLGSDAGEAADEDLEVDEPEWRSEDLGPSDRIVAFLRAHPNRAFSKDSIVRQTGLSETQTSAALSYLVKKRPEDIVRPRRGHYAYDDTVERALAEETERREALERQLEEERQASLFTRVGQDCHGRVVLNGPDGEMWIAIRVEPHFHSFS